MSSRFLLQFCEYRTKAKQCTGQANIFRTRRLCHKRLGEKKMGCILWLILASGVPFQLYQRKIHKSAFVSVTLNQVLFIAVSKTLLCCTFQQQETSPVCQLPVPEHVEVRHGVPRCEEALLSRRGSVHLHKM